MNGITSLFPEALVQALGWTLLHSLWQGAFVALLLSLLLILLHRHSAKMRYAVSGGAMLAQLLLAIGTFTYYFNFPEAEEAIYLTTAPLEITTSASLAAHPEAPVWVVPLAKAQVYFEHHLPLLVTLWLLGLLVMTLRLLGGVAYTQRLRHYRTVALGGQWQKKLTLLRQEMGISRTVQLASSSLVQVPVVIGYAKPIILLPVGAVTGLSQAQIEAILAHELAHILRKDYLFNLLQSVVDVLFFYHPATWWISGVVRAERENCCDDMAVVTCGDTFTYARALAAIEAMRLPAAPAMAVAFSGKRGSLMSRVKRLVGQQSLKPTFSEGFAAALVLVMGLLVLSFGAMAGLKPQAEQDRDPLQNKAAFESATKVVGKEDANEIAGAFAYTVQDTAGKARDIVIIKNKKGKVKELYVDGKRIPNRHIDDYKELIDQRLQAIANAPRANRKEVELQMERAHAAAAEARQRQQENYTYRYSQQGESQEVPPPPAPLVPPAPPAPPAPHVAPVPPLPATPPLPPVAPLPDDKEGQKRYKEEQKRFEKRLKEYEKEVERYEDQLRKLREEGLLNEQPDRTQLERRREMQRLQAERRQEMAERREEIAKRHEALSRKREVHMQQLKDELVKDGIIEKGSDNLNIQLNNRALYVNGEKQSQEMFEKYKELLKIKGDNNSSYNFQYNKN